LLDQVSTALSPPARISIASAWRGISARPCCISSSAWSAKSGIAPDILAARITAAVDLLADSAESALLRLHPDDVPLVQGKLPATIFPVGDPHVTRGSFVIESASTIVEDGPDIWLEQLALAIDRVPIPPAC
jgi:flagellar assembly protein FliH